MRSHAFAAALVLMGSSLTSGCVAPSDQALDDQDPHQPGEPLGMFAVVGDLTDDSCGAPSLAAPNDWSFDLKLSREGSLLYWLNGREAIVGDIDARGHFALSSRVEVVVSQTRGAARGCTMLRQDSVSGVLDESAASFRATLAYAYDATKASDCSDASVGVDGTPIPLPCALGYALRGSRASR